MNKSIKSCALYLSVGVISAFSFATSRAAPETDQQVLSKLHHGNQSEIAMAKVALKNGQSPEVLNYATQITTDHTAADQKVMDVAKYDRIAIIPIPENPKDKSDMAHIKSLNGPAFDVAYSQLMVEDHRRDIAELTKALPNVENPNIRSLGEELLTTFQHHKQMAARIEAIETGNAPA